MLELLEPVRERGGLVVELGCGSGLLTRHLVDAGLRVIATDASPAMLDLARGIVPDAEESSASRSPTTRFPRPTPIVGVGHALNYLPDAVAVDRALVAIAGALRPGRPARDRPLRPRVRASPPRGAPAWAGSATTGRS